MSTTLCFLPVGVGVQLLALGRMFVAKLAIFWIFFSSPSAVLTGLLGHVVHSLLLDSNLALSLLRKILMPWPSQRYKLDQIQNHIWVKKKFKDGEGVLLERSDSSSGSKRLCAGAGSLSQPLPADSDRDGDSRAAEEHDAELGRDGRAHEVATNAIQCGD